MANNYSVIQTIEDREILLSVLPSNWIVLKGDGQTGSDLGYWPVNNRGFRLLEKAKKNPDIAVDIQLLRAIPCKVKRSGFVNFAEANRALAEMESTSETDEYEDRKPNVKSSNAANLFIQIQAQPKSIDLSETSMMEDSTTDQASQIEPIPMTNGFGYSPELNPSVMPQSNVLTIEIFNDAMKPVLAELKTLREENSNLKSLLCQLNAKVDFIGSSSSGSSNLSVRGSSVKLKKASFDPIQTEEELKELEERCRDEGFVKEAVKSFGRLKGKNQFVGNGGTVCLAIVDELFTREFLTTCSWTGVSRTKDEAENSTQKIAFQKFERVINLFYQIVAFSDPSYPKDRCDNFLHYCLKNSKQRLEHKRVKKSSSRKRLKLSDGAYDSDIEHSEEEETGGAKQEVIYEEYLIETQ